jgi:Zn-dependent peptidase ImmA (M78 family)
VKKDDSTLSTLGLRNVRKYADLLLRKANAYGRFPTPVADLITAAKLEVARENALDKVFLGSLYRALPNRLKLAPDRIKHAAGKVLGLLDRRDRTIHLDRDIHPKRRLFISLHETGHGVLVWQRQTYSLMEDSDQELDPETQELFEREANCFASETLFQLDVFTRDAADSAFGIRTVLTLAGRYGSSCYSAARRYVTQHARECALLVFNPPVYVDGTGYCLTLRWAFASRAFAARFGEVTWPAECGPDHFFTSVRPENKLSPPTSCFVTDRNGTHVTCLAEGFDSTHQVFFLVYPFPAPRAVVRSVV